MSTTYEMTKKASGFTGVGAGFSYLMEQTTAEPAADADVIVPALSVVPCYLYTKSNKPDNSRWFTGTGGTTNFVFEFNSGVSESANVKMRCRVTRVTRQNAPMQSGAWTAEQACDGPRLFSPARPTNGWQDGDADDRLRLDIELRNISSAPLTISFVTGIGVPCMVTSPLEENPLLPDKVWIDATMNRTIKFDSQE